jgi:DNA-binding GntR family transcriptional regulator
MFFAQQESLAEKIANHIGEMIIRGQLQPGERVQEQRIAAALNVSRGSLREAFLLLERRYLIDLPPRRGAVVSLIDSKKVAGLYEIYEVLLTQLIRKATQRWGDDDLHLFNGHVDALVLYADTGDVASFYEMTFRFERDAYRFADNEFLVNALQDLQPALRRNYYFALKLDYSEVQASLGFFKRLMASLTDRNEDGAVLALSEFANHQKQFVLAVLAASEQPGKAKQKKIASERAT